MIARSGKARPCTHGARAHAEAATLVNRHVFTYHFYDGADDGKAKMHARELKWDDDKWPVLTDTVFEKKE